MNAQRLHAQRLHACYFKARGCGLNPAQALVSAWRQLTGQARLETAVTSHCGRYTGYRMAMAIALGLDDPRRAYGWHPNGDRTVASLAAYRTTLARVEALLELEYQGTMRDLERAMRPRLTLLDAFTPATVSSIALVIGSIVAALIAG